MRRGKVFSAPAYWLRHGSPDKVPAFRFDELGDFFETSCPSCGAGLCVDATVLAVSPEFDCAGCGTVLALAPDGSLRGQPGAERKAVGEA